MLSVKTCLSAHSHVTRFFMSLCLFALSFCSATQAADGNIFRVLSPDATSLKEYQWHARPVVIFAPSEKDEHYVQQMTMLEKRKAELAERDIIVLSDTSPASKGKLRSQLQPKGFEFVLVGKDGGMKLREKSPVSAEALLSTIDQMPMRRANLN